MHPLLRILLSALATLALAAPALASDFYTPSPVPSSRDNIRPAAKPQKKPAGWNSLKAGDKIVKTTRPANATTPNPAQATPAQ